jgi:RNA polymerase sigma factor (sigma-70 family)
MKWLITVARHARAKAEQRERRVRVGQSDLALAGAVQPDDDPGPEAKLIEKEKMARLRAAMGMLSQRQYEFLHLRAEGLTFTEIAKIHGISQQSVAETCARAIARLGRLASE